VYEALVRGEPEARSGCRLGLLLRDCSWLADSARSRAVFEATSQPFGSCTKVKHYVGTKTHCSIEDVDRGAEDGLDQMSH